MGSTPSIMYCPKSRQYINVDVYEWYDVVAIGAGAIAGSGFTGVGTIHYVSNGKNPFSNRALQVGAGILAATALYCKWKMDQEKKLIKKCRREESEGKKRNCY